MSKSKKQQAASNYVKTIRDQEQPAIAANIFRGNTADGFTYLYYELARSWKTQSGNREGYSKKFYDRNDQALCRVILAASEWITKNKGASFFFAVI